MLNDTQQVGSGINPECLQEVLDSARNASDKGQSQFYTPRDFGKACCLPLPEIRPCIVDLQCGRADLLYAAANTSTRHLLGLDIDPVRSKKEEGDTLSVSRITGDTTLVAPMLAEVGWSFDLGVFNPPFDLHWEKARLAYLLESYYPYELKQAMEVVDPRVGKDHIDSTIATLLIALDAFTQRGEGVLIANDATLQRLIFSVNSPYKMLRKFIWAHVSHNGNPMTGIKDSQWDKENEFRTGVIWFAKDHHGVPYESNTETYKEFVEECEALRRDRQELRNGSQIRYVESCHVDECYDMWDATKIEWNSLKGQGSKSEYNIWLDSGGIIRTNLSLFQQRSKKTNKQEAVVLHSLAGQRVLQLVVQKAQRQELIKAITGGIWRVAPEMQGVLDKALKDYNSNRAPLYPLNEVQRIAYCDEMDFITCKKDLTMADMAKAIVERGMM